jgi:hypothetical protein
MSGSYASMPTRRSSGTRSTPKKVEANVVREIDRTDTTVRATLRVKGREDFVKEWHLGELVTVVRGP